MRSGSPSDTIVAIATPPGEGPIGIVRLSGTGALGILGRVWICAGVSVDKFITHCIYYGKIRNLSTENTDAFVDEVLVAYFQGPRSYTGEDMVEVYAHGNPFILQQIVEGCVREGARTAAPGEFTQRAFLHGRIDLAQAEAVADLITASSAAAHRCATEQLVGRLSRIVRDQLDRLTGLRAFVEATIDFPEEDIEMIGRARVEEALCPIAASLRALAASYHEGRLYREGVRVVLVGCPNAGKSSLLNALLGEERAIVHALPGTTRDSIEEMARFGAMAFRLVDTAGLRESGDDIEQVGIARTRQQLAHADLVLLVVDGSMPLSGMERELVGVSLTDRMVIALNKSDLPPHVPPETLQAAFPGAPIIAISARCGDGLHILQQALVARARGTARPLDEGVVVTNARHKEALDIACNAIDEARQSIARAVPVECVAEHLRQASDALGQIVGTVTTDDLLRQIFGRFCIGK